VINQTYSVYCERDDNVEPVMVQFKLVKMSGVWLIDSTVRSKKEGMVLRGV